MWVDGYWVDGYWTDSYYIEEVDPEYGNYFPSGYWANTYFPDNYFQGISNPLVHISDIDRQYIYGVLGYPNIEVDDTGLLTDDIVDEQVILRSLYEYYRWFPIEEITQVTLSSGNTSKTVTWPDDTSDTFVFDVKDCRLAQLQDTSVGYSSGTVITNPIVQFRNISRSSMAGRFGSPYDYGFSSIMGSTNFGNDALTNLNQVFYNTTDHQNKTVNLYSQNPGTVQITFARYSNNVNYIPFIHKRDFLDLCRGELLLFWANNLKRINPEFPVAFDVDTLVEDGTDLVDKVLTKWKGKTRSVMMRG